MKKIIIILLIILSTGCLKKEQDKFNLIINDIDSMETSNLDVEKAFDNFERKLLYEDLEDIKEEVFEIVDENNLEEYYLKKIDKKDLIVIMVISAKENKKEEIKKEIDSYFEKLYLEENSKNQNIIKERIEYEYEDYLIFIAANNKKDILDDILTTKEKVFKNTITLDEEAIKQKFNINTKNLKNYKFKISSDLENINDYIIIEGEDLEELREKIDAYYDNLKNEVAEEQKVIIEQRLIKETNDYLIVIVTNNNEKVLKEIEKKL